MDIEDFECDRAEKKLLIKLEEVEEAVKDGEGQLDLDELKYLWGNKMLKLRINPKYLG